MSENLQRAQTVTNREALLIDRWFSEHATKDLREGPFNYNKILGRKGLPDARRRSFKNFTTVGWEMWHDSSLKRTDLLLLLSSPHTAAK